MPVTFTSPNEAPWPTSTAELDPSERLIVWAFRRWLLGLPQNAGEHWSFVWNDFARQFGAQDGKEALSAFTGLIKGLQCYARRTIHHHQPCCPCLGADEVCLVSLVAACQNHQRQLARALAEWMVQSDGVGDLLEAGMRLARVMQRHSLNLPGRTKKEEPDTASEWPLSSRTTVH